MSKGCRDARSLGLAVRERSLDAFFCNDTVTRQVCHAARQVFQEFPQRRDTCISERCGRREAERVGDQSLYEKPNYYFSPAGFRTTPVLRNL